MGQHHYDGRHNPSQYNDLALYSFEILIFACDQLSNIIKSKMRKQKFNIKTKESIFKKAKEAYERDNWYTLYSVAVDLGIEVGEIDEKHIDWIEEDIKLTMGRISQMGQLFAWVWYTSDDEGKKRVMDQYFKQVYNWPPDGS